LKAAVVNRQFGPIIPCKGRHVAMKRFPPFLREYLTSHRMHRTEKYPSPRSASLATLLRIAFISIGFISLALAFSEQAYAQTSGNASAPQPAIPLASAESADAPQSATPQEDVHPQPEGGWYNSAVSAKLSGMSFKNWGILSPNFGDVLLGNVDGIRSKLADHGIAGIIAIDANGWQDQLSEPASTDGMEGYYGSKIYKL
jgi:hypothetical protein